MTGVYPPLALLLARHTALLPAECLIVGAGVHFLYRRGPHLVPPHQILGLAPTFLANALNRLGLPFERHIAPGGAAGLAAITHELAAGTHGVLVQMPDGLWEVLGKEADTFVLDNGHSRRAADADTLRAEWFRAVPAGEWYSVAWQEVPHPSASLLRTGLVDNAHAMLISSGAWQGVDGIEFWGEDLVTWPDEEAWPASASAMAAYIRKTGALWRCALAKALEQLTPSWPTAFQWRSRLEASIALWAEVADHLADAGSRADAEALLRARSRVLRLAAAESRFWGHVLDALERPGGPTAHNQM